MPDWRYVTQVSMPNSLTGGGAAHVNNMWIDLDGVDTIMHLPTGRINGARSRLGWLSDGHWHYIFVAEQIDPTRPGEANNNPQKEE